MSPNWFATHLEQQPTVADFELEGARLSYRHWRDDDKPGLVFVHGHAAHARWWDFIAPAFQDTYSVAALDLSGSGDSDHRAAYSPQLFAREIIGCIESSGMGTATVVGHSFGGTLTRSTAFLYPERINAVILADSHIPTQKGARRPPPLPRGAVRNYPSLAEAVRRFRLRPPQPPPEDFILNYIAEHSIKETAEGWCFKYDSAVFAKMTGDGDLPVAADMIRSLQPPVALIYGALSRFFPPSVVATLPDLLPAELTIGIPQAHHHVFLDQPRLFIDALENLLSVLPQGS